MAMLRLGGINVSYGEVQALWDVSLEIGAGEIVALVGSNGAGKTTTLKTISGLLHPTSGTIEFDGKPIHEAAAHEIVAMGIAHIPEGRRLWANMTVRENLEMGCYLRHDRAGIEADLQRVFERFPILGQRREQAAGTLSGGEQQMLAISRALMSRPKLVLFDEPSLGLAPNIVERTFEIIRQIRADGVTVVMVEQNAAAALELSDRAYVMEQGAVALSGKGAELLGDPHVQKAYLGVS